MNNEVEEHKDVKNESVTNDKTQSSVIESEKSSVDNTLNTISQAVIGSKIFIKGEVIGDQDILVQGEIEGSVTLTGHTLTVAKDGKLSANVSASKVVINGSVKGDVFGESQVAILKDGNMHGNIFTRNISIEDGAKFHGSVDMGAKKNTDEVNSSSVDVLPPRITKDVNSDWLENGKTNGLINATAEFDSSDRLEKMVALNRKKKERELSRQISASDNDEPEFL